MSTSAERRTPIRVLICQANLSGGGQEKIALELARGLSLRGLNVKLFLHEARGDLVKDLGSVTFEAHTDKTYQRWRLPLIFVDTLRNARNADVVIGAHEGRAGVLAVLASLVARRPVIAWIHIDWREFGARVSWRTRATLVLNRYATHLVAVSQGALDGILAVIGENSRPRSVIYNGIDLAKVETTKLLPPSEHLTQLTGQILVAVGRLSYQKGFDILLHALRHLKDLGHAPHLLIVGQGELRDELVALARDLGVLGQCHFLGYQRNPYPYMKMGTVVVVPSRFEGFGIVIAEALAVGTPVIATDCKSGPSEILGHGEFGRLTPVNDPEALAHSIAALLESEAERARLSHSGPLRARAFDNQTFLDSWETLINQLAGNAPGATSTISTELASDTERPFR